ncbi:PKD domain-containing protein [Paenibacillus marinisediminis]
MRKITGIFLLLLFVFQLFEPLIFLGYQNVSATGVPTSSRNIVLTNETTPNPGYYWCQRYNGDWQTDSFDGYKSRPNDGGQPKYTTERLSVKAETSPPNNNWAGKNAQGVSVSYNLEQVVDPKIKGKPTPGYWIDPKINGTVDEVDGNKIKFSGMSGKGVLGQASPPNQANSICGHMPGYIYPFPIDVDWIGHIPLSIEIEPTAKSIAINEKVNLKATAVWGYKSGTKREAIPNAELKWTSEVPQKVTVDSNGVATGVAPTGSTPANVVVYWEKWDLTIAARITVNDDGTPTGDFDPVPNKIPYGDTFNLVPKNINIPSGKTLKSITYKIYNPSRTQHTEFTTGTITNVTIDASKYPHFIEDKEQSYPIDMFVTDSKGRVSPTVTKNVQITKRGVPTGGGITGDFEITPSKIKYRDTFNIVPKDIKPIDSCTYISHVYKIDRQGYEITTSPVRGMNTKNTYEYANYPPNIGVGYHDVYMKIYSSCGETEWIGPKPLIIEDNGNNTPPVIKIGFVDPAEPTKRLTQVVQGTTLDLVNIYDGSIPVPYDAEGDEIEFLGFDFSRSTPWGKTIPSISTQGLEAYHGIYMGTLGVHRVDATAKDAFGGLTTATTYINVIPANPIPVIECPPEVTANKPYNEDLFSSKYSYSPKKYGRIDHARDEWLDKLLVFKNETDEVIDVKVGLHVYDTDGLKSSDPAYCTIKVKPDTPPIAKLDVPSFALRYDGVSIVNNSYTVDGAPIVAAEYKYKYDRLNNGFEDDAWQAISETNIKGFEFSAPKVGKYLFYTKVTKEGGRVADTSAVDESTLTLNVINRAPEVSFDLSGVNKQPPIDNSTVFSTSEIYNWDLKQTNSNKNMYVDKSESWEIRDGMLNSKEAKNFYTGAPSTLSSYQKTILGPHDINYQYFDLNTNLGLGNNSISPYKAVDPTKPYRVTRILDTYGGLKHLEVHGKYAFYVIDKGYSYHYDSYLYITELSKIPDVEQGLVNGSWGWRYKDAYNPLKIGPYVDSYEKYDVTDNYLYIYNYYNNGDSTSRWTLVYDLDTFTQISRINHDKGSKYKVEDGKLHYYTIDSTYVGSKWIYKLTTWYYDIHGNKQNIKVSEHNFYEEARSLVGTDDKGDRARPEIPALNGYEKVKYKEQNLGKDIYGNTYYLSGYPDYPPTGYEDIRMNMKFREPEVIKVGKDNKTIWKTAIPYRYWGDAINLTCEVDNGLGLTYSGHCRGINMAYDLASDTIAFTDYYSPGNWGLEMRTITINVKSGAIIGNTATAPEDSIWAYNGAMYDINGRYYGNLGGGNKGGATVTVENDKNTFASTLHKDPTQYVPIADGIGLLMYQKYYGDSSSTTLYYEPEIIIGEPTSKPRQIQSFTSGQFFSPIDVSDVEMKFNFKLDNKDKDKERFGFSFRMQGPLNKYAIEFDTTNVYLMKYVNGVGQSIKLSNFPVQDNKTYSVRLRTVGDKIELYINNIPYFSITDGTYKDGAFGYFSNKSYVNFGALSINPIEADVVEWMDNYAIWEPSGTKAELKYENINFDDPEKDPMAGKFAWSYKHMPMFLRNQGVSSLDGKSFESTQLTFDKVGRYVVSLKAKDDPHPEYLYPDNRFNEYRMDSNEFVNQIIVHRRPVAKFQVSQQADGMINWNDESYDPDRWMSPTEISKDNTSIDYAQTRGILERKYYYISPTGKVVNAKLTAPQEKGMYEIGLSVKDEYGAWSQWAVNHIDVGVTIADSPPVPGFIPDPVTTYRNVDVSFQSTAYDKEDGNSLNLDHKYYISNMSDGKESLASAKRDIWYKQFTTLGTFKIRQVVTDSSNQSAETSKTVQIINRVPVANISYPDSTNQTKPTLVDTYTPTITWTYTDADLDPQTKFEVEVYKYGGILAQTSGILNGSSQGWKVPAALQDKTDYYVVVRVFDGYEWGQSAPKYMRIHVNSPPVANFDYMPKPPYEGDTVRFSNKSTDPDGDPMTYKWQMSGPNLRYQSSETNPTVSWITPGIYMVTLTASDGTEEHSITKQIEVLPLGIQGQVLHTKEWLNHLQKWNEANPDKQRSLNTFWAGESFELVAKPTVTGTATTAVSIKVYAERIGQVQLTKLSEALWTGYIAYDNTSTELAMLADGEYTFVFTVTYSNGVQKTTKVPINILGNWDEYFRFHRSF